MWAYLGGRIRRRSIPKGEVQESRASKQPSQSNTQIMKIVANLGFCWSSMAKPKPKKSSVGAGTIDQDLPKGWPASCNFTYAAGKDLVPGITLQQSCNGADIFLKKRAVQSTSTDFPVLAGNGKVLNGKSAQTRFLVIFPGRLNLKVPDDDCAADDKPDDEAVNKPDPKEQAKKKSPFAPANPPRLLGKLVSLGGEKVELRMPGSDGDDSPVGKSRRNHLILSGKTIPLAGKYMSLSLKRGGKASKGGNAGKRQGGDSLHCKDVFRSVIVLGESFGGDDKVISPNGDEEMNHYGASSRSLDGGDGQTKKKRGPSVEESISPKHKRSRCTSSGSEDEVSEGEEILENSDEGSDAEFVIKANGKRKSRADDIASEDNGEKQKKRTPRRSVTSKKITYVDAEEDADEITSESESSAGTSDEGEIGMKGKAALDKRPTPVARASVPRDSKLNKNDVIELDADSCSSPSKPKTSPLRRKKNRSSSKKRKSQLETIDLYENDDDEFRFLG